MDNEYQIKQIISRHITAMMEELGTSDTPPGWIPDNANEVLTRTVYNTIDYGHGVEKYLEKQGLIKD